MTNEHLLSVLEDQAKLLQKSQINLKKCPKARLTRGYIEARLKVIDDYWNTFKVAHQELVKNSPKGIRESLPYFVNEDFHVCEEIYTCLQGDLKDMLTPQFESAAIDSSAANTNRNTINIPTGAVHLPRIQLPVFSGSYEEWPAFKDLFISLVHNNETLGDVHKLHYLKASVSGEAQALLKPIQVTSKNYVHGWEILNTRYGNKRLILNYTMKRLFNQRKMNTQSAVQLKCLLDTTTECINNLNNLSITTSTWDPVIIYLLVQKLDTETHKSWEEYAYKDESQALPTWIELKKFLESKFRTLELISTQTRIDTRREPTKERSSYQSYVATPVMEKVCIMCKDNHTLWHCKEFIKMGPSERSDYVRNKHLCFNCLVPGHPVVKCKSSGSCRICHRRHHSLLHVNKVIEPAASSSSTQPLASSHVAEEELQVNTMVASTLKTRQNTALLATAIVEAISERGHTIPLRALIDPGSQATFISEKATQLLKLERQPVTGTVIGVGSTRTEIKHVVQLNIRSQWDHKYVLTTQAYVMSKQLTTKIPAKAIIKQSWPHILGLNLADPKFFMSGSIDLLLGVKEYTQILQQSLIKGPPGTPSAQKTSLGWILFGEVDTKPKEDTYIVMHHRVDVEDMLKSIWEIETDIKRHFTKEEKLCEDIYKETTTRNSEGRYIVKLPFKTQDPQRLPRNTKETATQRFLQLERKFRKLPDLKREYSKVINEYIEQGYAEKVPEIKIEIKHSVYLPHHAVIRNDKETTRTRVVFDASSKGSNNISLNDELLVGPQLQEDLRNILMRWRMKRVCFVADIKKMYLQILVTTEDSNYQRILWRSEESENLKEYCLRRVTFGTAPAPYLAVKTLHQLADDEGSEFSIAAQTIKEDFYMDDLLSGTDETESAIKLAKQITEILHKGGFQLTKWSSNDVEFMKSIDEPNRSANAQVDINLDGTIKALGIKWNLRTDEFQYNITLPSIAKSITKRNILSDIQKLFDPLGWLAPSTIMAKILIQKLWLEKVRWDDHVSESLEQEWRQIRSDFRNVDMVKIERWLCTTSNNIQNIQIHGFSDVSMRAYAAVAYMRVENLNGNVDVRLIAARTRVAPIKTVSLPRLELCGALLLSKLMKQIGQALRIATSQMYAWTDSEIVIAWLCGEPNKWKPFVANRVVEIVENLNNRHWHHVQSQDNPADIASRGMLISDLRNCEMWWRGPSWISEKEINISTQEIITTEIEMKNNKIHTYHTIVDKEEIGSIPKQFENFDNLTELIKTITYCKRFLNYKKWDNILSTFTTEELENSLNICIKMVQYEEFSEEINRLKMDKEVRKKSPLQALRPYLDEENIVRVGGRLRHANLPNDRKHPIILGNRNTLALLIVADAHFKTLHGGVQLMLCYLRSKYWIIKSKSMVKKCIHKCIICAKHSAKSNSQIMGDLPKQRVTPSRPFLNSGVDFAGPFQILISRGRGNKTTKAYVAIFVCMSTKAIHIELVGDLTSEAFVGAFRRFVSRRGRCSHLWSDQGRNFVGANKDLRDAWNEANLQFIEVSSTLAIDGTQWHFIPAYSPNFGGLWEAGVKSIKHHLKRIITNYLTYEEMTTVLCQIESCLNSRPLCPIDEDDTENIDPLTPGHFLVGEAPIVVPSPTMKDVRIHTLTRWQHTQKLLNDFWRRWQDEYLSRLQQRPKWLQKKEEFEIGDIVLIKAENLPPGKWSLGRIITRHPGPDGCVRVYGVKSGGSITKRTVTKLCPLPI